jgi:SHS2 domain-containing protein
MYELFEHTADLGLRVRAADLNALFAEAARGLFAMVVENLEEVREEHQREFAIAGTARDDLLFDWLNELLYVFDTEHMLFSQFSVQLGEAGLRAVARGEPIDRSRHHLLHEIKAITYHGLLLQQTTEGWLAEVIVDI